jgi:hypothetical protein
MDIERQPALAALAAERHDELVSGSPIERAAQAAYRLLGLELHDNDGAEPISKPSRTPWFGEFIDGGKKMATRIERLSGKGDQTYQVVLAVGDESAIFGRFDRLPPEGQAYIKVGKIRFYPESLQSLAPFVEVSGYIEEEGHRRMWQPRIELDHPAALEILSVVDEAVEAQR